MASNALLVRWNGGWAEVDDSTSIGVHGRREALLGIGAVQSSAEVERVANGQLSIFANPRTMVTAGIEPSDDSETPYLSCLPGDTVSTPAQDGITPVAQRIVQMTVSEDAEGNPVFAPGLNDVIFTEDQRFLTAVKKMTNGTLSGQSVAATPASQVSVGTGGPSCCSPQPSGC